jgi:hypothetical protein
MTWTLDQKWSAHASAILSYSIDFRQGEPYVVSRFERIGSNSNFSSLGTFNTLPEAQSACDTNFAAYQAALTPTS